MKQKCYYIKIMSHFSAAHVIPGHPGACARLHGHNWKVDVEVKGTKVNDIGIAIDFHDVKAFTKTLLDQLDHRYLNEIPPFDQINPTAENIAAWVYERLQPLIDNEHVSLEAVTLWETDTSSVRYTEEEVS